MADPAPFPTDGHAPGRYEIRLQGRLDSRWADWFAGLDVSVDEHGHTLICGDLLDQAALYGLLRKVRDLGIPLLSVTCIQPDSPQVDDTPTPDE